MTWFTFYTELPKPHRYTLGLRIDNLLVETIEIVAVARFSKPEEKTPFIARAIGRLDVINLLLAILWETKSLEQPRYLTLSKQLNEVGKMLGGWKNQLATPKPNSPSVEHGES